MLKSIKRHQTIVINKANILSTYALNTYTYLHYSNKYNIMHNTNSIQTYISRDSNLDRLSDHIVCNQRPTNKHNNINKNANTKLTSSHLKS